MAEEIGSKPIDVQTLENIDSFDDLPDVTELTEEQLYAIRSGDLSSDYIAPFEWNGESYEQWRSIIDGTEIVAIPDISMFNSPIRHFWAGQGIDVDDGSQATTWTDQIAGTTASASDDPRYRADQDGFEAVEYFEDEEGGHEVDEDFMPTGSDPASVAALIFVPSSLDDIGNVTQWGSSGEDDLLLRVRPQDGDVLQFETTGSGTEATIGYQPGEWMVVGGSMDDNGQLTVYHNDSLSVGDEITVDIGGGHFFGYDSGGLEFGGFIAEFIFSDVDEPDDSFSDYYESRLL